MSENREIFELSELSKVACICDNCGTEVIFDACKPTNFGNRCPGCGQALYPLQDILNLFLEIHRKAADAKLRVRVYSPATPPKP